MKPRLKREPTRVIPIVCITAALYEIRIPWTVPRKLRVSVALDDLLVGSDPLDHLGVLAHLWQSKF